MVVDAKAAQRKLCPGCQAELDINEKTCPYCGSKQLTRLEIVLQRFMKSIFPTVTPTTKLLLLINIMMFVIVTIDTTMHPSFTLTDAFFHTPGELIWRWGAQLQGEAVWWRMVTANFVHIGIIHILFNMMALRYVGPYVERTFGSALTFAAFVLLGSFSMFVSNVTGIFMVEHGIVDAPAIVAGASGAIMAFIGMSGIAAHIEHTPFSIKIRNSMIIAAAATILFGVIVNSSVGHGIDNIAHIAGLVGGIVAGLLLPKQNSTGFTKRAHHRLATLLCIVSFAISASSFVFMTLNQDYEKYAAECVRDLKLKDYTKAVESCKNAVHADKSQVNSWNNLILANALAKKMDTAAKLCDDAKDQFKGTKDAEVFTPMCYQITGN